MNKTIQNILYNTAIRLVGTNVADDWIRVSKICYVLHANKIANSVSLSQIILRAKIKD
jgi:hypothetical protein